MSFNNNEKEQNDKNKLEILDQYFKFINQSKDNEIITRSDQITKNIFKKKLAEFFNPDDQLTLKDRLDIILESAHHKQFDNDSIMQKIMQYAKEYDDDCVKHHKKNYVLLPGYFRKYARDMNVPKEVIELTRQYTYEEKMQYTENRSNYCNIL